MPQATTKTYQLFRETLLNATSEDHKRKLEELVITLIEHGLKEYPEGYEHTELKDITLEDVLMAVMVNFTKEFDEKNDDRFIDVFFIEKAKRVFKLWNLTKPAHLQSEETLLEIIKLLK